MDLQPLTACVATALRDNRVRFGDVRRLERALPRGEESLDALELLLALDRAVSRTDQAWTEFLVDRVRRFVLGTEGEDRGAVAERIARLIGARPTTAGTAIRADLAVELMIVDPPLAALFATATRRPARRPVKAPAMAFATEGAVPDLSPAAVPAMAADAVPLLVAPDGAEPTAAA